MIECKTNWTQDDYFNAEDYNRIKNNIAYIRNYMNELFINLPGVELGEDKNYESMIYAKEINAIEEALDGINANSYMLDVGEKQVFYTNGTTPKWTEFNRIESAIELIAETMTAHENSLPKLNLALGKGGF